MLRYFFIAFILGTISIAVLAGFRGTKSPLPPIQIFPDMKHQPRYDPQHESTFFANGSSCATGNLEYPLCSGNRVISSRGSATRSVRSQSSNHPRFRISGVQFLAGTIRPSSTANSFSQTLPVSSMCQPVCCLIAVVPAAACPRRSEKTQAGKTQQKKTQEKQTQLTRI